MGAALLLTFLGGVAIGVPVAIALGALMGLINGLVKPSSGSVTVNGIDTAADESAALAEAGFIFQNPQNQLIMPVVMEITVNATGIRKAANPW